MRQELYRVASHVGSIDLMGYSQAILGYPMHGVVKDIHWKPAQDYIRAVRERTGVTAVMYRRGNTRHFDMTVEPFEMERPHGALDADIRHNTERLNAIIEGWIRADPGQWLWLHKRWKVPDHPEGWDIPEKLRHLVVGAEA